MSYEPRKLPTPCEDCGFIICKCDMLESIAKENPFEYNPTNTEPEIETAEEDYTKELDLENKEYEYIEMSEAFNMWRD